MATKRAKLSPKAYAEVARIVAEIDGEPEARRQAHARLQEALRAATEMAVVSRAIRDIVDELAAIAGTNTARFAVLQSLAARGEALSIAASTALAD